MVAAPSSANSAAHTSEIELKLEFAPADASRLVSHPALAPNVAPPEERELVSTYFDTPDCALHKAGLYLRVREIDGRFLQTIKAAKGGAGILERYEWEHELVDRRPDLDAARGTALEPFLTAKVRAALQPIFETRIQRRTHRFRSGDTEIEAAFDRGAISTKVQTCPICELELELKLGDRRELFRLARTIAKDIPLRLEIKTKAERGFELYGKRRLEAEKALPVHIPPTMPAAEAFRLIALSCLRQIVANEPAVCAGHTEALHQMRIGVRRLRAAIAIFSGLVDGETLKRVKAELRWIMGQLGPARELDVFAADVLEPLRAGRSDDPRAAALQRDFEQKRKEAYAAAGAAIQSERFRAVVLDLAEWIETGAYPDGRRKAEAGPVAEYVRARLAKLRKRIKRKGAELRHLSVEDQHRLRIAAKRLRYATEFFASTFPGERAEARRSETLKTLKELQDSLGGLNDLATHRSLMVSHAGAATKHTVLSRIAGGERAETLLRKAEQAFARFAAVKPFWKAS